MQYIQETVLHWDIYKIKTTKDQNYANCDPNFIKIQIHFFKKVSDWVLTNTELINCMRFSQSKFIAYVYKISL